MGLSFLSRKRRSPSRVVATQSQQSGVRGPCRHGFSLTYMLLPRRARNEVPSRRFLPCGTRQPAVCGRQSASACGMFLARQHKRRYRLKREDLHGDLCAWRRCRRVLRRMRPGAWGRDSRNRSGIGKVVTFRSVTGEEKMRGVKRDRFASEA